MRNPDSKLDDLIAFILATASADEEWTRRALSMIHLVKYAYLADLYTAEAGNELFTGASWQFFHFGPWDAALPARVERSLARLGAQPEEIPNRFGDDRKAWRWSRDLESTEAIRSRLPSSIRVRLPQDIHRFANDTPSLLDSVYKTKPMLGAAPRETLTFENVRRAVNTTAPLVAEPPMPGPSTRKRKKKLQRAREALAGRIAAWRVEREAEGGRPSVDPAPRYDDVFASGSEWLDSLAGDALAPREGVLTVDASVWHSPARNGSEGG